MTIKIEKAGPVWTIINSRPEARNAINPETADGLYQAFVEFEEDDSASVAVFWGEGGAFCSGWDLKNAALLDSAEPFDKRNIPKDGGSGGSGTDIPLACLGPTRLELDKPVIAAATGPAVAGGMELALWYDFCVLEESFFRWNESFVFLHAWRCFSCFSRCERYRDMHVPYLRFNCETSMSRYLASSTSNLYLDRVE
ncbi:MAG: enoyl-CoA hydratase-related protein [Anaerolineae bacterium]